MQDFVEAIKISNNDKEKNSAKDQNDLNQKAQEPVSVYCRLKPLSCEADLSSIEVMNSTSLILRNPIQSVLGKTTNSKEIKYIFRYVFEGHHSQREVFSTVAAPLVENLVEGRNSLLLTYGVSGSGKTFTMTGDSQQPGIMPRCMGLLFRAIKEYQAPKCVFKPDKFNSFEILPEEEASLERSKMKCTQRGRENVAEMANQSILEASPYTMNLNEDNMFAVFVTYCEVYNNSVYDLLDISSKVLQNKIVREDANHNMYVHNITEIEIKSVEEGLEIFHTAQKRKRMAHTALNADSSRSHSVFNIRLVQAPTDAEGSKIVQDKTSLRVSQLSLVDLAGSERCSRSKNTGVRLREAGNINNSLMTLRTCLEYLRENQKLPKSAGGAHKKIPYRDAKITHLFKNFFEGHGQISMIVCVNPRLEDLEENTQVLKFAEMAQEVQTNKLQINKNDLGLTPGRRKANKVLKISGKTLEFKDYEIESSPIYSFDPGFPDCSDLNDGSEKEIQNLKDYLQSRIEQRLVLSKHLNTRFDSFRTKILNMEKEKMAMMLEIDSLKAVVAKESERNMLFEKKFCLQESSMNVLNKKLANREHQIDDLTRKIQSLEKQLACKEQEKWQQKKRFNNKIATEVDKKSKELETKLRQQRVKLEENLRVQDEKLRLVSNIVHAKELPEIVTPQNYKDHVDQCKIAESATTFTSSKAAFLSASKSTPKILNAHVRKRSKSADAKWIEHRSDKTVPVGTILQPFMRKRKSINHLPNAKDLTEKPSTKYCLISQEADTDGELETKLYKGEIIPTCGGGAQVVFNDVEMLKQKSPLGSPIKQIRKVEFSETNEILEVSSEKSLGILTERNTSF